MFERSTNEQVETHVHVDATGRSIDFPSHRLIALKRYHRVWLASLTCPFCIIHGSGLLVCRVTMVYVRIESNYYLAIGLLGIIIIRSFTNEV